MERREKESRHSYTNTCALIADLVEPVDVLRDDRHPLALHRQPPLQGSHRQVPVIGPALRDNLAAVVVELPHQPRVAGECVRRGQVLGGVGPPQPAGPAERGDA